MSKLYRFANRIIGNYSSQFGRRIEKAIQTEQKQAIKEIYVEERKEHADQARELFKKLCHAGKIRKAEQSALRELLECRLGGYAEEYKGMRFDNEFHRLYTMLKSYHLDQSDWHVIFESLERIQHSS
jgi:hypothetical protein